MSDRRRPNILWLCTDQQRWDTLGCYGNDHVSTPNLDDLASTGVRFDRCFSQSPVCSPSRDSFLTGRYPRTTGVRQNGQQIQPGETLVTRTLSEAGYTCGLAGKLHLGPVSPGKPEPPKMAERRIEDGYADFHWSHHPWGTWPTNEYQQWLREAGVDFEWTPYRDSEYVRTSVPAEYHQTTWCADRAITFVEECASFDEPWLFSFNCFDPHVPFDPPEEYLEPYVDRLGEIPLPDYEDGELEDKPVYQRRWQNCDYTGYHREFPFREMTEWDHRLVRASYWAMIDLIDDQVGRILEALERTGQRENTIVVFTSDHGEMLGDHGIYLKGPFFYEPAVRVPLLVSWPAAIDGGRSTDALVELTDLAPTLLDLAGLEQPLGMQGQSFGALLDGTSDGHREDIYCEYYDSLGIKYGDEDPPFATMVRTDRYKLVNFHRSEMGELYDLHADPEETHNRWDDDGYAAIKRELLERLSDKMADRVVRKRFQDRPHAVLLSIL